MLNVLPAEVMDDQNEDSDIDLERQNVEELYDCVRHHHQHQHEAQGEGLDLQHEALVPVLRPYQSQAVNWMLRREKYNRSVSAGNPYLSAIVLFWTNMHISCL